MQDYHINLFYSSEDQGYIADIPDLKSCSAFGETAEEALREVQIAKRAWLETCRARKKPIPKPRYRRSMRCQPEPELNRSTPGQSERGRD
jgi:predicted RNase H-like HicB family nuclease